MSAEVSTPTREQLVHSLYEAAELEHNLMCTYLYAAFSLRDGPAEGLSPARAEAVARWRRDDHAASPSRRWATSPRCGTSRRRSAARRASAAATFRSTRARCPPASSSSSRRSAKTSLQHFIFLERPDGSQRARRRGLRAATSRSRAASTRPRLTPMALDYETVGVFYATLGAEPARRSSRASARTSRSAAIRRCSSRRPSSRLQGAEPVICLKTALAALRGDRRARRGRARAIPRDSHFQRFIAIREELAALKRAEPGFSPAFPAATNPVCAGPCAPEARVWIENEEAARTVDAANTGYALMLRLLAYSYLVPRPAAGKVARDRPRDRH